MNDLIIQTFKDPIILQTISKYLNFNNLIDLINAIPDLKYFTANTFKFIKIKIPIDVILTDLVIILLIKIKIKIFNAVLNANACLILIFVLLCIV